MPEQPETVLRAQEHAVRELRHETNRGYGSEEHLVALQCLGPTPHHRMSFSPLNRLL